MKYKLSILLLCFFLSGQYASKAQGDDLEQLLSKPVTRTDCDVVSSNVEIQINQISKNNSIAQLIGFWERSCGKTEPLMRLKIMERIKAEADTDSLIAIYFRNYSEMLFNRISDSKTIDYGRVYADNKKYYSYIPLHGYFDNYILEFAENMLNSECISKNEELICLLFSFNTEEYKKKITKKEYRETEIAKINYESLMYYLEPFTYNFMLGAWMPIQDTEGIFGLNPQLGIGFGFRGTKFEFGLSMQVRINVNDKSFEIKAKSDTIMTNTDFGLLLGVNISYKLYTKNNWQLYPNFGFGWDIIETDVEKSTANEEVTYYDISAVNLSMGFKMFYEVAFHKYIGVGANYHFVPYHTDNNYFTRFSSDYLTFNLIYKF